MSGAVCCTADGGEQPTLPLLMGPKQRMSHVYHKSGMRNLAGFLCGVKAFGDLGRALIDAMVEGGDEDPGGAGDVRHGPEYIGRRDATHMGVVGTLVDDPEPGRDGKIRMGGGMSSSARRE